MPTGKPPRKSTARPKRPGPPMASPLAQATGHPVVLKQHRPARARPETDRASLPASARLVVEVRSGLGVTRALFSRLIGFSIRAISGWEAGRPISEAGLRRVKEMDRLREALAGGLRPEFIPQWLDTPCEGLGGLKPVEVLERGEADRLWRAALLIGSGMPT